MRVRQRAAGAERPVGREDAGGRDRGASSVEYGLVVFAIAATIVLAVVALGPAVYGLFDTTGQAVNGGVKGPPTACS